MAIPLSLGRPGVRSPRWCLVGPSPFFDPPMPPSRGFSPGCALAGLDMGAHWSPWGAGGPGTLPRVCGCPCGGRPCGWLVPASHMGDSGGRSTCCRFLWPSPPCLVAASCGCVRGLLGPVSSGFPQVAVVHRCPSGAGSFSGWSIILPDLFLCGVRPASSRCSPRAGRVCLRRCPPSGGSGCMLTPRAWGPAPSRGRPPRVLAPGPCSPSLSTPRSGGLPSCVFGRSRSCADLAFSSVAARWVLACRPGCCVVLALAGRLVVICPQTPRVLPVDWRIFLLQRLPHVPPADLAALRP